MTRTLLIAFLVLLGSVTAADKDLLRTVSVDAVDLKATASFHNGHATPVARGTLAAVLSAKANGRWQTPEQPRSWAPEGNPYVFHFRLAFTKATAVGSLSIRLEQRFRSSVRIAALKAGATYPGNPARAGDWQRLPHHAAGEQLELVLPPGFKTRALLITEERRRSGALLSRWQVRPARLHNLTPAAVAQGEQAPYGADPMTLVRGGRWANAGPVPKKGNIERIPVSSVNPSWFTLVWEEARTPVALRLRSNIDQYKLHAFRGGKDENPALAAGKSWERIDAIVFRRRRDGRAAVAEDLLLLPKLKTRAIRLQILETIPREQRICWIDDFTVWQNLGNERAPPPVSRDEEPPFKIAYELANDGEVAFVVNDAAGRRVRNLIAQVDRKAGKNLQPWDLKGPDGAWVAPGTYTWKAIYAPPPVCVYRMTPYPNVADHSPKSTPWPRGPADGWLMNHGNPRAVCAVGDHVVMGGGGAEGGHEIALCTLAGEKIWGTPRADFHEMCTDDKIVYVRSGNHVKTFDPETKKQKHVRNAFYTPKRKGRFLGIANHADKIYLAFHGPDPFVHNNTHAGAIDIANCLPKLPKTIKGGQNYGIPATPQHDFVSLFRYTGYVRGSPFNGGLLYIPSTIGRRRHQYVVLAYREPVPVGSLVFPAPKTKGVEFGISIHRQDATYPPNPEANRDWIDLKLDKLGPWNVAAAPPKTRTRAIRLRFSRPGDELDDLMDGDLEGGAALPNDLDLGKEKGKVGAAKKGWRAEIAGMRVLRRRFRSLLPSATIKTSSGRYDPKTGAWDAQRKEVLTPDNPAVFTMEWPEKQKIRALAVKEIDGARTEIDVFVGRGPIDPKDNSKWQKVAAYRQVTRDFYQPNYNNNAQARYIDGTVDFGKQYETRAVRLRVVAQWRERGGRPRGVRHDRGATAVNPRRCRIYGVAPLEYLGGEAPVDPLITQRLEEVDAETGKLLHEYPSAITGKMAFNHRGELFGIVGRKVVRIDIPTGKTTDFITDLKHPRLLTFDGKGSAYVYEHTDENRVVRVYRANSTYSHTIGRLGRRKPGPYDPHYLEDVSSISVDKTGHVWMVYPHDNPRRCMKFTNDGKHVMDFLGNTNYGGGGCLDPFDKTKAYFRDLIFDLDWKTGKTKLAALMGTDHMETSVWSDRSYRSVIEPIVVDGRRYIVTAPLGVGPTMSLASVQLMDETGVVRKVAAFGEATAFPFLRSTDFLLKLGKPLGAFRFHWTDWNGDGDVQFKEVKFIEKKGRKIAIGRFDYKLGVMARTWSGYHVPVRGLRYEVEKLLPNGVPVFRETSLPFYADWRFRDGSHFRFHRGGYGRPSMNQGLDKDGEIVWSYRAGIGMQGLFVPPWKPGYADLQYAVAGHAVADRGDLGEFVVVHSNAGQVNIWTADGLLAGQITLHTRNPKAKRFGSFPDHSMGTPMPNLSLGQEHFHCFFTKSQSDGKFYLVAGPLEINILEVTGLEKFKRLEGKFEVTPAMLAEARRWDAKRVKRQNLSKPKIIDCAPGRPVVNGVIAPGEYAQSVGIPDLAGFSAAYGKGKIFLAWTVRNAGPMKNAADVFQRAFKTGAAVDVKLSTDPKADSKRRQPVRGDLRLLVTRIGNKPTAILYRPVSADGQGKPWQTSTPAGGTTKFDDVSILKNAEIAITDTAGGYTVEAAVPLQTLGLRIREDLRLRLDWGVLSTDAGNLTTARQYWADKTATGVSDEPTEARLNPGMWGHIVFRRPRKNGPDLGTKLELQPGDGGEADDLEAIDNLLE